MPEGEKIDWGASRLTITRRQQLDAAKRVEDWLIEHPKFKDSEDGLTRDDLLVLIRGTRGY